MDDRVVLAKTQKGKDEIETRQNRLPIKLRVALILVDGKSSVAHLVEGGQVDLKKQLEELVLLGYVEEVPKLVSQRTIVTNTVVTNPVVPVDSKRLKEDLIRISRDVLGEKANKVIKKIEEAPETKDGLSVTLRSCIALVDLIIDERKSKALSAQYDEILKRM